jgi:penicillin-binding protein 1C
MDGCDDFSINSAKEIMEIIYPNQLSQIYIPVDINGDTLPAVFHAAHRNKDAVIYWYIDDRYLGTTKDFHEKGLILPAGKYTLTLMDNKGNKISRLFSIVNNSDDDV